MGDIVTHCYKGSRGCLLVAADRVREEARDARARGVLFDVGHGSGSFSWEVTRAAMAQGFLPDSISTDLHALSVGGPANGMPWVMSKLLHLGMDVVEVIRLSTTSPARMLGMEDRIGSLKPGSVADVVVLRVEEGSFPAVDCVGVTETVSRRLAVSSTLRAGARA